MMLNDSGEGRRDDRSSAAQSELNNSELNNNEALDA